VTTGETTALRADSNAARSTHPAVFLSALGAVAVWGLLAWPNFKFAHDDFILFTYARLHGPGRHLLYLNVFGHFAPLNHLLYWVDLVIAPLNVAVGFAIGALFVLTMLLAFTWLLHEVGIPWRRQAVSVAFLGLSITVMAVGTWWGTVVHVPLSLAALFMILAAHVRACRQRSLWWHIASIVFLLFGLLLQERAGFAVGIAVVLDLFVVWRSMSLLSAFKRLWAVKWAFIAMTALVVPWYYYVLKNYYGSEPAAPLGDVVRFFPISFGRYFLPAVLGFYTGSTGMPPWLIAGLLVLTLAGAVVLVATRRENLKLLLFFIAVYSVYYGLVAVGRLGIYSIDIEASDLQYAAYVLPFLVVAIASATFPRLPACRWRPVVAPLAAVAVIAGVGVTDAIAAAPGGLLRSSQIAHRWEVGLTASRPEWTAPSVGIVPLRVPVDVAAPFVDPYGREETFLRLIAPDLAVGVLPDAGHWAVIDDRAAVRSADLRPEVLLTAADIRRLASPFGGMKPLGPVPSPRLAVISAPCFLAAQPGAGLTLALPRELRGVPLMVEVRGSVSRATTVRFGSTAPGILTVNAEVGAMPPGNHTVVYNLDGQTMRSISLGEWTPGTTICLQSLAIVRPVLVDGGTCHFVDRYGQTGDSVACGHVGVASVSDKQAGPVVVEVEADLRQAFRHHRLS